MCCQEVMTQADASPGSGVKDVGSFHVKGKKNLAFLSSIIGDGATRNLDG